MNENVNLALQLLLVGMGSVFIILGIVVVVGRSLISVVNKYSPAVAEKPSFKRRTNTATDPSSSTMDAKHLAVLSAVVDVVTQQNGVLKSVKKISSQ